jgi:hypothetical protein
MSRKYGYPWNCSNKQKADVTPFLCPLGEIAFRRFNHKMTVVFHQTVSVAQPVKAVNDLAEDLQEGLAVPISVKNILPRVTARGHVVQSTVKFYSERTSHEWPVSQPVTDNKIQDLTITPL